MKRYMVVLESGPTSWGAHVPDLPGCVAVGKTRDETAALIQDAVSMHIEGLRAEGAPVPPPVSDALFVEIDAA